MGSRDDNLLDDMQAEQGLRRIMQQELEAQTLPLTSDIVARTLQQLPQAVPSAASRQIAARRQRRMLVWSVSLLLTGLVAIVNIWNTLGGVHTTFMFGGSDSTISVVLFGAQLAVKPLWNSLRAMNPVFLVGAPLLAFAGALVWWWLLRRMRAANVEDL